MGTLAGLDDEQAEAGTSFLPRALNLFVHTGTEELVIHFIPFPKLNGLVSFDIPSRFRFLKNKATIARYFLRRVCLILKSGNSQLLPSSGCCS